MIKLTKLCNKRRIEEERTPPENDFGLRVACLSHRLCLTSCANYSRNENLSTQDHRILVIKNRLPKTTFPDAVDFPMENLTPLDQRCVAPMRRYAPLLAHTLRRTCGGRRPELDPACLSTIDYVNKVVQQTQNRR